MRAWGGARQDATPPCPWFFGGSSAPQNCWAADRAAVVAAHPRQPVVAVGYADGAVKLVRIDDDALIRQRGRDYEQRISAEYLTQLNDLYESWVEGFALCPVLTVPTDTLNFVTVNTHLELIANRVLDKLHGKEVVVFE